MSRAAAHPFFRRLMAALTVLAAFAFQVRADGSMPGWWASAMSAPLPEMPMSGHMAHHQAEQTEPTGGPPGAPEKAHNHGAHCPFCVTNAFALDDAPFVLTAERRFGAWQQDSAPLTIIPRFAQNADARAPPAFL